MRYLNAKLILMSVALMFSVGAALALPKCSGSSVYRHNCFGDFTYGNGNRYVGPFKEDKQNGQGTYTFANGDKYVGEFKNNKRNGQGTFTFADGRVAEGIWKDNEFQYAKKVTPQPRTIEVKPSVETKTDAEPASISAPKIEPKKKRNLTKEFGVSLYGSFLHSEKVPNALFFFDNIEKGDSFEFRKALRNHDADLIILSSPGGSVSEGLSIAGIINDKTLNTYVPKNSTSGKGNCASACSFMYFAGKNRTVNGALGVHQFYSSDDTKKAEVGDTQKSAQFTVSEIIGFLNEFETPPWVFERMFQQSEMYYFKESELVQLETETTELQQATYGRAEAFISELRTAFDEMED